MPSLSIQFEIKYTTNVSNCLHLCSVYENMNVILSGDVFKGHGECSKYDGIDRPHTREIVDESLRVNSNGMYNWLSLSYVLKPMYISSQFVQFQQNIWILLNCEDILIFNILIEILSFRHFVSNQGTYFVTGKGIVVWCHLHMVFPHNITAL